MLVSHISGSDKSQTFLSGSVTIVSVQCLVETCPSFLLLHLCSASVIIFVCNTQSEGCSRGGMSGNRVWLFFPWWALIVTILAAVIVSVKMMIPLVVLLLNDFLPFGWAHAPWLTFRKTLWMGNKHWPSAQTSRLHLLSLCFSISNRFLAPVFLLRKDYAHRQRPRRRLLSASVGSTSARPLSWRISSQTWLINSDCNWTTTALLHQWCPCCPARSVLVILM